MLSQRTLPVGEMLEVTVVLEGVEHRVTGRVVRQEPLAPGESTIWRTKVAIAVADHAVMQKLFGALG